ncbi:MAG: imidazole glycerol phosphate synthase subunit HisH [Cenarchaeum sp. SB0664_bin_35]|nr:imidazole glycerol phosphate synthase subunit HisH [Cenarchaeum sp. SB0664_bin_35]
MVRLALYYYGAGNIFSLKNAFERRGATVQVISELSDNDYSGLLLPGVGSFDTAMNSIYNNNTLYSYVGETMPVLGICLGMEMFFERSQEGSCRGLSVMDGEVVSLPDTMKVPHMGWNSLQIQDAGILLDGISNNPWMYFVHSYMARPNNTSLIKATSDYGITVPAVVEHRNYFGTQFHPEKSGTSGGIILDNFMRECSH